MTNIQQILDKIQAQKFSKLPSERVHHYYSDRMISWRKSELNRIKNQGKWRHDQKLTPEQADEIRRLHWEQDWSMSKLSEHFKVAPVGVKKILHNKRFYNKDTKYVGIKFRDSKKGKPAVRVLRINVYDENGNFIKQDDVGSLSKELGITPLGFRNLFVPKRKRFHKKSKRYYFRDWETPKFDL